MCVYNDVPGGEEGASCTRAPGGSNSVWTVLEQFPPVRMPLTVVECCGGARFDCAPPAMSSAVSIYYDGSVLVTPGGLEMGQGLHTKMKQVSRGASPLLRAHVCRIPAQGLG